MHFFTYLRRVPSGLASAGTLLPIICLNAPLQANEISNQKAHGSQISETTNASGVRKVEEATICPTALIQEAENDDSNSWLKAMTGVNAASCYRNSRPLGDNVIDAENKIKHAISHGIQKTPTNVNIGTCFPKAVDLKQQNKQQALVAEFHISAARLDSSATDLIALQNELNALLPNNLDVQEPSVITPQARNAWQNSSENCENNPTALADLSEETHQAILSLKQAEEYVSQNPEKTKELEEFKNSLFDLYPWLNTDRFQNLSASGSPKVDAVQSSLTSHFSELRQAAARQLGKIHQASHCLAGAGSDDCWDSFADTLSSTPKLNIDGAQRELGDASRAGQIPAQTFVPLNDGLDLLNGGMCTQDMRDRVEASGKATNGLIVSTALTLATFGAGSLVTGAAAVGRTGVVAHTANASTKAGQAWKTLTAARVSGVHRAAANAPKLVSAARLSILATDTGGAVQGISEAKRVCSEEEQSLSTRPTASTLGPACAQHARKAQLAQAERGCAMAVSLAAVGLLPFVPAALNSTLRTANKGTNNASGIVKNSVDELPEPASGLSQPTSAPEPSTGFSQPTNAGTPEPSSGFTLPTGTISNSTPPKFKSLDEITSSYVGGDAGKNLGGPTQQAKDAAEELKKSFASGDLDKRSTIEALRARWGELEMQSFVNNGMGGSFNRATDMPLEWVRPEVATEVLGNAGQHAAETQYYRELFDILRDADNMKQGQFGVGQ